MNRCLTIGVFTLALCLTMGAHVGAASGKPRLILIKADALPPDLLAALSFPEREDYWRRLSYREDLRQALRFYQEQTGRSIVLPNIRHYFFQDGVYVENCFSETLTLSPVSWAVIDTGQPSVIKGTGTFSRDTCYLRYHLDGLRDTIDAIRHKESTSAALWNLDQVGVSLMPDAFDPDRVWSGLQIYRRKANRATLVEMGRQWVHNDRRNIFEIVQSHLSHRVTGRDYTEFAQEVSGLMTARKILAKDLLGEEQYDYLSPLFTLIDHQQHVDPHPQNLIHWTVKLDRLVGRIFEAVERSTRRNQTVVAIVSDHGSEIQPGKTAFSFPITEVFRTRFFGGHTVKTLLVENAWNSVTTPVAGIDSPRVYESPHSPYGEASGGNKGFITCFIDNFGNGRSSVNLRNDDLNRLHLILREIKRSQPDSERWLRLISMFRETLAQAREWLEPDVALYRDYHEGARDMAAQLLSKAEPHARNVAWRLKKELDRDSPQIATLELLLGLRFAPEEAPSGLLFQRIARSDFKISSLIPRAFLGIPNQVYQLSHYTLDLDENLNWVTTTVDPKGHRVPLNYYQILTDYRVANAPVSGHFNPHDLIVTRLPTLQAADALRAIVWDDAEDRRPLNVLWVKSTAKDRYDKGGEALIVEDQNRQILYLPVAGFEQASDLTISFQVSAGPDPLGLLGRDGIQVSGQTSRLDWVRRFHSREDWLEATFRTEYSTAVCILLDITNNPTEAFIDSPDFQRYLAHFSSPELKARYLRGLKRKYANQQPDFLVWSDELWNFNSSTRTSGGSHSGFRPIAARTAFLVWGGENTRIARGKTVSRIGTTLDVVPTLAHALGMLDKQNRIIPQPGSIPERVFSPFPGRVIDIFRPSPQTSSYATDPPVDEE